MANSQKFTLTFDAQLNVNQMKGALSSIQSELSKLKLPANISKGLQDTFDKLSSEVKNFENISAGGINSKNDLTKLEASANKVLTLYEKLQNQAKSLGNLSSSQLEKLFPENVIKNIEAARAALKSYTDSAKAATKDLEKANAAVEKINGSIAAEQGKTTVTTGQYKQISEDLKAAETEVDTYKQKIEELTTKQKQMETDLTAPKKSSKYRDLIKELDETKTKYEEVNQKAKELSAQKASVTTNEKQAETLAKLNTQLMEAQQKAQAAAEALKQIESIEPGGGVQQLIQIIGQLTGLDMSQFSNDVNGAAQALQTYLSNALNDTTGNLRNFNQVIEQNHAPAQQMKTDTDECVIANQRLNDSLQEVSALKKRIQYFFGLQNTINLVKRAIRGAFDTIKSLDKAMTETAVVTDFSVSDMWAQLPEYTKRANELGVTTQAAYEAATLYYQQGLKTNEVNALSVETLKMARIAGLDAAEATDRMTNALRGFNMELTTANAQRVDDVYSELAANTASNVDEISTAMTKVASLAHNANMEFETTAAFLAQIIETTRESAETAGTALKTVVARFSEVKKLVDEGTLRGQDEEGQAIDVNKVGAALRTAGIDLNKYFLGEVGLDDIFMELASKWDSLTSLQQRYIATQAAGSRQQSRFIALMSDYARTQELVGKAYNANGAAARQFAKTQESLESKLARLKNAWNEFLMGLTNNQMVKGFVDLLTDLLNAINKITSAFGEGTNSILKWGVAIGGVLGARSLLSSGGLVDKGLMALLSGTGLGNALTKAGVFGGDAVGAATSSNLFKQIATSRANRAAAFSQIGTGSTAAWSGIGAIGQFGTKIGNSSKIAQALSKTKFASGLGSLLGFGTGGTGAVAGATAASTAAAGLATALGAVTVAAVAAGVAIKAVYDASPAGQLKIAEKYANALSNVADNAKKTASQMQDAVHQIKDYENAVANAATPAERSQAIQDQNEYILSLLEQDATYAQFIQSTFEEGNQLYLTLDSDALARAVDKIAEGATRANAYSNFAEAIVQQQTADFYRNQLSGINLEDKTRTYSDEYGTYTVGLSDEEFRKYSRYQAQIDAANIAMQNYATTAASQVVSLQDSNLDSELANLISSAFGQAFDAEGTFAEAIEQRRTNWWHGKATDTQLRHEYSRIYGTDLGESYDKSEVQYAIALGQVLEEQIDGQIPELLNTVKNANGKLLLEVITGAYEGTIDDDQLKAAFESLTAAQKKSIETLLQTSGDATFDALYGYNAQLKKSQITFKKKAVDTLYKSGLQNVKQLDRIVNELTISQQRKLVEIANELTNYGTEFSGRLLDSISTAMLEGDYDEVFQNFTASLSDNPVLTFQALKEAAESTNPELQKIVRNLGLINSQGQFDVSGIEALSNTNQVQWFLTSDEFDGLADSISKLVEENGHLTSDNIEKLAVESKTLATLLDNDIISARGLANALNALQEGEITVFDLNENVLKLFDSFDSVTNAVQRAGQFIKDFDPGEDWGDAFDFIENAVERMTELVENRELGNPQLRNYWKAFFTTDPSDLADWEAGIALIKQLQGDGGASFWTKAVGFTMDKNGNIADMGLEDFANSQFNNYADYIRSLAEANGFTNFADSYYDLMIRNAANHDYGFLKDVAAIEVEKLVSAYGEGLAGSQPSKADIQAIADAYGFDPQEILNAYTDKFGLEHLDFSSLEDKIRQFNTSIWEAYNSLGGNYRRDGMDTRGEILKAWGIDENGVFSIDTLYAKIGEIVPEVADGSISAAEWVQEQIDAAPDGVVKLPVTYQVVEKTGEDQYVTRTETVEIEVSNLEEYQHAVEQIQSAANSELLGSSLTSAFTDAQTEANALNDFLATLGENVKLDNITGQITTCQTNAETLNDTLSQPINKTITVSANASQLAIAGGGQVITFSIGLAAMGGIVRSAAKGTIEPGLALTGEEAPEIVWNKEKGYAYLTGSNGPEIQNLQPGDEVFNGDQTKQILKRSGLKSFAKGTVNSYAGTIWKPTQPSKDSGGYGGGGSGSNNSKEKNEEWKNEIDWLYNLVEDIAELERIQAELQEQYDDYLIDQTKTGQDLYKLLVQQLANLYTQLDHQTFALEKREQEMREFMDTTNQYDDYLWYNWDDRTIEIDWDAIEALKGSEKETYDKIVDLISEAEDIQGKMDDAEDAIADIKNQIQDLEHIWRDTFTDFEERVYRAIVKEFQTVIDNYSQLNDTINNSNQEILSAIQKEIALQREIRENTKTEEEITNNESQLAYLRRDTSGGNEVAALELEKQLSDQRESYEDNLIDQAISRLQEDNDAAAQQREHQIEIMQAQLDYQEQNGEFNAMVLELLQTAMGADGELLTNSDLMDLLRTQENWAAMSEVSQQVWEEELNTTFKEVAAFLLKQNAEENGTFTTALTSAIEAVNASIGSYSQGITKFLNSSSGGSSGSGGGGGKKSGSTTSSNGGSTSSTPGVVAAVAAGVAGVDLIKKKARTGGGTSGGGGCFAPGTKILMENNKIKEIQDVKIGDIVIAYDEVNQIFVPKKVTKSYVHHDTPAMVKIYLSDDTIMFMTPGHPIYTTDGWKSLDLQTSLVDHGIQATLLNIDDIVIGVNNSSSVIKIEQYSIPLHYDSYNLEVEGCHTFLANGFVVHNAVYSVKERYATGGLNTQTGPAWLDGTPSEPEYVLNARQTEAFLKLADVLPNLMSNSSTSSISNTSNVNLNLTMNIDKIDSDYDVDRIAGRVKEIIYNAGSYRNVNTLNFSR